MFPYRGPNEIKDVEIACFFSVAPSPTAQLFRFGNVWMYAMAIGIRYNTERGGGGWVCGLMC